MYNSHILLSRYVSYYTYNHRVEVGNWRPVIIWLLLHFQIISYNFKVFRV